MLHCRPGMSAIGAVVLAGGLLAACGSSRSASGTGTSTGATAASGKVITFNGGIGSLKSDVFNPWSPNAQNGASGMVYEPLLYFDTAKAGVVHPWLATSYAWSNGGKTVTFQLRHGVRWSDGTAFTSADVVFTFDLEMKNPALNTYSLPYKSVTASGPYTVTVNFTQPAYEDLIYIGGKTVIVQKKQWSSVSAPATFTDPHPVGTGAYLVKTVTSQATTFVANPHYYMKGLPHIKVLRNLQLTSNTAADPEIEAGQVDWAEVYIPGINKAYASKAKTNVVESIPLAIAFLEANDVKGPTASLAVRQAISYAMNRSFISHSVYNGYAPPTNPEMLLLPNFKQYLNPALSGATLSYDPAKAKKILEAAGYKLGSNGIFVAPDGKPLRVTVQVPGSFTDYVSVLQIMSAEERQAGIDMVVQTESTSEETANQQSGNFQLILSNGGLSPSLYAFYYPLFDSAVSAPIGKTATGDYGRFHSSGLNADLAAVAGLSSASARAPYYRKIEALLAAQLPYIPVFSQQNETEFNAAQVTGYPTASNPYAATDPWLGPDMGWVAMNLRPVK